VNCVEIRRAADALIDGELSGAGKLRVEEHLKYCAQCRQWVDSARRTRDTVRSRVVKPEPPGRLETRIRRALDAGRPPAQGPRG